MIVPALTSEDQDQSLGPQREIYFSQENRRVFRLMIGGCLIVWIAVGGVEFVLPGQDVGRAAIGFAFCSGIAIWLTRYLWPQVRINRLGISSRTLWWWTLIPWEAFAEGRVRYESDPLTLRFSDRPWWRRTLNLELLGSTHADEISNLIEAHSPPPEPGELPPILELRLQWPDSRRVQMTATHCTVSRKGHEDSYRWQEVETVTAWWLTASQRAFRELTLKMPNQVLTFKQRLTSSQKVGTWTGSVAEDLVRCVRRYMPPDRFHDYAVEGEPQTLQEIDAREQRLEKLSKSGATQMKWCRLGLGATLVVFPFTGPWQRWNWLEWVIYASACSLIMLFVHLALSSARAEINAKKLEFELQRKHLSRGESLEALDQTDT